MIHDPDLPEVITDDVSATMSRETYDGIRVMLSSAFDLHALVRKLAPLAMELPRDDERRMDVEHFMRQFG